MTNKIYYSREDVEDAYWILGTSSYLNHGLPALLWAQRVRVWAVNVVSYVKAKYNDLSNFDCNFINTLKRVKRGEISFKDTP